MQEVLYPAASGECFFELSCSITEAPMGKLILSILAFALFTLAAVRALK